MTITASRVARNPVLMPSGVEAKLEGDRLTIKGPKGQTSIAIESFLELLLEKNSLSVQLSGSVSQGKRRVAALARSHKARAGTLRSHIANIVTGVSKGFERKLVLVGVGYRAQVKGQMLTLTVGKSHPEVFLAPEGIQLEVPSQTEIVVKGTDRRLVGHVASVIRAFRPPEPYKGKGIRYSDEVIELKETKKK